MKEIVYTLNIEKKLETFLLEQYPTLSFNKLCKYLKENKIKVNSKKVPLNTHLFKGDIIKLYILDEFLENPQKKDLDIIYEDKDVIIVNKPQSLIAIDENNIYNDSLINRVLLYLNIQRTNIENDFIPCLCHRLDFGTSGLVIIAKNKKSYNTLSTLIKEHKIKKEYKCITYGYPKNKTGKIETYLLKDEQSGFVKIVPKNIKNSKYALTYYTVEKTKDTFALLNIELLTGRTHQIRVHLSSIGCPILGDSKYGNNKINRECKFKYQALCAYKLTFPNISKLKGLSNKTFMLKDIPFSNFFD